MNKNIPRLQVAIYKIKDDVKNSQVSKSLKQNGYEKQKLKRNIKNENFTFSLFYLNKKSNPPWKTFFEKIVGEKQKIITTSRISEGFVFLLLKKNQSNKKDNFFYAFTGGIGHFAIKDFIEPDFGIKILLRMINSTDKVLRAVKENSLMGNILGESKYFRTSSSFYESENFGKIYQEMIANLDNSILTNLNLDKKDFFNNSYCVAKSSFKINKSLTFNEILDLVQSLHKLYKQEKIKIKEINSIKQLNPKKDKEIINKLNDKKATKLFELFKGKNLQNFSDFDICHKEFEKFLTSTKFKLIVNKLECELEQIDLKTVFEKLKKDFKIPKNINKESFINKLHKLKIVSLDSDNNELTKDYFLNHLSTEIQINKNYYFLMNGNWYYVIDNFIEELNTQCKNIINENFIKHEDLFGDVKWNKDKRNKTNGYENEKDFNNNFSKKGDYLVLDRVTPENIEPCDILKWDENNLYLIHVKKGFNQNMRDLCCQVYISAKRIFQASKTLKEQNGKNTDNNYIEKVFNDFKKSRNYTSKITQNEFKELFKKNLIFVIAVLDTAKGKRELKNIEQFNSNIAKFSLRNLYRDLKTLGLEFKITQIKSN